MEPQETGRRYDAIASVWDAKRQESMQGIRFLEQAIALCKSYDQALDVGCGSGGHMINKLLEAGFYVTGLDVSTALLDIAKARHPEVSFIYDDITKWEPQHQYDLVLAWDSIFHLPHSKHAPVIKKLCACLTAQGILLFTAGGIDSEIMGSMYGHDFEYSSLSDSLLLQLVQHCGCTIILMERDQFPLHHLVIIATKSKLCDAFSKMM